LLRAAIDAIGNNDSCESGDIRRLLVNRVPHWLHASVPRVKTTYGIVVLGCHRSGTSALAGALVHAGAYPGPPGALVGATAANPNGHFERIDALLMHDRMLSELGGSWWSPPVSLEQEATSSIRRLVQTRYRAMTQSLREEARERRTPWVLKDPRLSILLPLVSDVLRPQIVVVLVRDPREVARSLAKRDGIGISAGLALWEVYTRQALRASAALGTGTVVLHEELIKNPERVLRQINEVAGEHGPLMTNIHHGVATIDRSLVSAQATEVSETWLTSDQENLWQCVRDGDVVGVRLPAEQPAQALAEDGAKPEDERQRLVAKDSLSGNVEALRTRVVHLEALADDLRLDASLMAADLDRRLVRAALVLSRNAAPVFRLLRQRPVFRGLILKLWQGYRSVIPLRYRLLVPTNVRRRLEGAIGGVSLLRSPFSVAANNDPVQRVAADLTGAESHLPAGIVGSFGGLPVLKRRAPLLFATYFPQFHVIPENERWWGKGYTDWDRVIAAQPQFVGHAQPRRPGTLGRYDPTQPETVRVQAQFAREAGVDGFMVYGYLFEDRTLLEDPLRLIADDSCCDLTFFVCWANENWTRVWDGRNEDVLLEVDNTISGVLGALAKFESYFASTRYFRIGGRPAFGIYAPQLIADETWAALINELASRGDQRPVLVLVDGVGLSADSRLARRFAKMVEHGDAIWVAFPPRHPAPRRLIGAEIPPGANPRHQYFAYSSLVDAVPSEAVFGVVPGVVPAWDNTARRDEGASILVGATPSAYGRWLETTLIWARKNHRETPFVLVNGWNEWSEGAYLEPDEEEGFARIHATRRAVVRAEAGMRLAAGRANLAKDENWCGERPAAIVHAFFPHLLPEIIKAFDRPEQLTWWVTTAADTGAVAMCTDILSSKGLNFQVRPVVNRGRDIWPFILLLEEIYVSGAQAFLKLHTKRSPHRMDGDRWRRRLVRDVAETWARLGQEPGSDDGTALVIPAGHAVSIKSNLGANDEGLQLLLSNLGGVQPTAESSIFASGSMFIGRVAPFVHVLHRLNLTCGSFAPERGQLDGTMAHTFERGWAPLLSAMGYGVRVA
jgi:lipopolysaccharide biosynthesis protein